MFYYLSQLLDEFDIPGMGMLTYVSFRSLMALIVSLIVSWIVVRLILILILFLILV